MRDEPNNRIDDPTPPSFWLRLAKAGTLVLVGAIAHVWLPSVVQPGNGAISTIDVDVDQDRGSARAALATATTPLNVSASDQALPILSPASAAAGIAVTTRAEAERPSRGARSPARTNTVSDPVPVGTRGVRAPADVVPRVPSVGSDTVPAPVGEAAGRESARIPSAIDTWVEVPTALPVRLSKATFVREVMPAAESPLAASPTVADAPMALPSPEERIQRVLQAYRTAFERLDAAAAASVWPTVDVRALGYAFSQLAEQRLLFESCGISVSGDAASARCRGQAQYLPKVGGRRALVTSGEWVFNLARRETDWQIVAADVK